VRTIVAANPSPMTLDGTRTYLIGRARVAVIDPGPRLDDHLHAVADAVGGGVVAFVLVTHSHPDHAEGAAALADRLHTHVLSAVTRTLHAGDVFATDAGAVHAMATPGHTPDHFSFWWERERAIFCGDLLMGGMESALVARPEGDLAQYLASLRLLQALRPRTIYPAHGPPFDDADATIERYVAHREDRIAQVLEGLKDGPLPAEALLDQVYGSTLDPRLRHYAETAIEAYLAYLRAEQRVRESASGVWSLV
jgi:glyoxylase-like metal-dependent hydrolase (beta-lactamase superfamily II)